MHGPDGPNRFQRESRREVQQRSRVARCVGIGLVGEADDHRKHRHRGERDQRQRPTKVDRRAHTKHKLEHAHHELHEVVADPGLDLQRLVHDGRREGACVLLGLIKVGQRLARQRLEVGEPNALRLAGRHCREARRLNAIGDHLHQAQAGIEPRKEMHAIFDGGLCSEVEAVHQLAKHYELQWLVASREHHKEGANRQQKSVHAVRETVHGAEGGRALLG